MWAGLRVPTRRTEVSQNQRGEAAVPWASKSRLEFPKPGPAEEQVLGWPTCCRAWSPRRPKGKCFLEKGPNQQDSLKGIRREWKTR